MFVICILSNVNHHIHNLFLCFKLSITFFTVYLTSYLAKKYLFYLIHHPFFIFWKFTWIDRGGTAGGGYKFKFYYSSFFYLDFITSIKKSRYILPNSPESYYSAHEEKGSGKDSLKSKGSMLSMLWIKL